MRNLEKKLLETKLKIEKYVFHPYLSNYITPPVIDENKILILISIVDCLEISPREKESIVLAIMLMYIALDTHDEIKNIEMDDTGIKTRQLTVLAGDFYSGLYYTLLAKMGNIEIIKLLSEGVKNINQHKVFIYHKDQDDLQSVMDSLKMIEYSLIEKLTNYYGLSNWNRFISDFLLLKRLEKEIQKYKTEGTSVVIHALERIYYTCDISNKLNLYDDHLIQMCENYMENIQSIIKNRMINIPNMNGLLRKQILQTINHSPKEKSFVEEG